MTITLMTAVLQACSNRRRAEAALGINHARRLRGHLTVCGCLHRPFAEGQRLLVLVWGACYNLYVLHIASYAERKNIYRVHRSKIFNRVKGKA